MADNNAADSYKTCISKYNVNNDADYYKAQALSVIASVTCDITGMQTVRDERMFTDTGTQTVAAEDAFDAMETDDGETDDGETDDGETDDDGYYLPSAEDDDSAEEPGEETEGFVDGCRGETPLSMKDRRKYIVFWSSLVRLFSLLCCASCGSRDVTASRRESGSMVIVDLFCRQCQKTLVWYGQPYLGTIPAGNILLSAAILFAGAAATKTLLVFSYMGVAYTSTRTYLRHQKSILQHAVRRVWSERQEWLFASLQAEPGDMVCGGDGRADSPGHCAKYGTYTLMELDKKVIIDVQIVQVFMHAQLVNNMSPKVKASR